MSENFKYAILILFGLIGISLSITYVKQAAFDEGVAVGQAQMNLECTKTSIELFQRGVGFRNDTTVEPPTKEDQKF